MSFLFTIHILYSTLEYDIIIGIITNISAVADLIENTSFKIGEKVLIIPDYYNYQICPKDPLMSICVNEECIFKIPLENISPLTLYAIKYGCIVYINKILNPKNIKIIMYSKYNVFKLIKKFMINNNIEWRPLNDELTDNDIIINNNIIHITSLKWIIIINHINYCIDLQKHSLIYIFGKKNINIIINIIYKQHILTDIYYIPFEFIQTIDFNDKFNKSRFFSIISFS